MLNKEAVQIIQGISEINTKAILTYPQTTIRNVTKDVQGVINFDKICEPFDEFGIWDLSSFLSALSILEEPEITMTDNIISAKDEFSSIEYVTSSTNILGDSVTDPEIISSTLAIPAVVEFELSMETIAKIKKGVSVFKNLKDLEFSKVGETFTVKTTNKESFNASNNSFSLTLPANTAGDDFSITIPSDNFLQVPSMPYTLKIHEKAGKYRISMTNAIFEFVLSLKK